MTTELVTTYRWKKIEFVHDGQWRIGWVVRETPKLYYYVRLEGTWDINLIRMRKEECFFL